MYDVTVDKACAALAMCPHNRPLEHLIAVTVHDQLVCSVVQLLKRLLAEQDEEDETMMRLHGKCVGSDGKEVYSVTVTLRLDSDSDACMYYGAVQPIPAHCLAVPDIRSH